MEHLEGRESVLAALQTSNRRFQAILIRQDAHEEKFSEIVALAQRRGIPVRFTEAAELDALAHGATHGGVLAIVSPRIRWNSAQLLDHVSSLAEAPLLLLIEGIEDARNLGFVLRTADALGVHAVLIKKHVWDFDPVEVARPASGAYERLPLVQIEDVTPLHDLSKRGIQLLGCIAGARRTVYNADLRSGTLLAIGGEKRGLSGALRRLCDGFITIPTRGQASLSLSHAAAILMAECFRQRRPPTAD